MKKISKNKMLIYVGLMLVMVMGTMFLLRQNYLLSHGQEVSVIHYDTKTISSVEDNEKTNNQEMQGITDVKTIRQKSNDSGLEIFNDERFMVLEYNYGPSYKLKSGQSNDEIFK